MRTILQILIVLTIGFLLGGGSAWYSIQRSHGIGAINIGSWTAWPFTGGNEADPYTLARVISDSTVPLGAAEGLAFEATEDMNGERLNLECNYVLEGRTPKAKLWTLTPYRQDGAALKTGKSKIEVPQYTNSKRLLRYADGTFSIALGPQAAPGNWLATEGKGLFRLVLRLYDTPITASAGLISPQMPLIKKVSCQQ
ncbi:MAG: DUF1214 domain-containing protein [Rhizobiaceae bacterium]|nr:DUF1214 domain-containing protein [Rhizobiaceae bacterium]